MGLLMLRPPHRLIVGVERTIESIRQAWAKPGARVDPNADGWNTLFDSLLQDLRNYAKADNDGDRLTAINQVYQISEALGTVSWPPAANIRAELRQWLVPRVRLAWARQRLRETVQALPASTDPGIQANRSRWVDFVQNDLGRALRDYDAADSVSQRQGALRKIHEALNSLNQQNQGRFWQPSWELSSAVSSLFNQPNLDITADVTTVAPVFDTNLVQSGPVDSQGIYVDGDRWAEDRIRIAPQRRRDHVLQQPVHGQRDSDLGLPATDRPGRPGP